MKKLVLSVNPMTDVKTLDGKIFWDNLNRAFQQATCTIVRDEP